jgi:hypothetical protein
LRLLAHHGLVLGNCVRRWPREQRRDVGVAVMDVHVEQGLEANDGSGHIGFLSLWLPLAMNKDGKRVRLQKRRREEKLKHKNTPTFPVSLLSMTLFFNFKFTRTRLTLIKRSKEKTWQKVFRYSCPSLPL